MRVINGTSPARTFALGFVVGGLVGAATTLLLAPRSGEEMQAEVKAKALALKEKTERTVVGGQRSLQSTATTVRDQAADTMERTASTLHQLARKLKSSEEQEQRPASGTVTTDELHESVVGQAK